MVFLPILLRNIVHETTVAFRVKCAYQRVRNDHFRTILRSFLTFLRGIETEHTHTHKLNVIVATIKTREQFQWLHSCVFIVNFELIRYTNLMFLLLTLKMYLLAVFRIVCGTQSNICDGVFSLKIFLPGF